MKKVMFILILFLSCFFIYKFTIKKDLYYLSIGDYLALNKDKSTNISKYNYTDSIINYLSNNNKLEAYNVDFVKEDYRISDLIRSLKYKEEIINSDKHFTLHELLKKADILTVSVGMNELTYKLNSNTDNIYAYIDNMLNDYSILLNEISRYNYKKVYILGFYNTTSKNSDIINYLNYKLENIVKEKKYEFINLNIILNNNKYFLNNNFYSLTDIGYNKISQIIIENLEKSWYNIVRI